MTVTRPNVLSQITETRIKPAAGPASRVKRMYIGVLLVLHYAAPRVRVVLLLFDASRC